MASTLEQLTELIKTLNDVATNTANTTEARKEATEVMSNSMKKIKNWIEKMQS